MTHIRTEFTLARIIGNELPPRDLQARRLEILRFILSAEFLADDTSRFWVINRVLDGHYLQQIKLLLDESKERYFEEEVDWPAYSAASDRDHRLRILININGARNRCIAEGKKIANFTFVLDGDCFFDKESWAESIHYLQHDQRIVPGRSQYAIPIQRVAFPSLLPIVSDLNKLEEPIVVFRKDSKLLFDESRRFGNQPKQELLLRMGLKRDGELWSAENSEECAIGGYVLHLQTGSASVDEDVHLRMKVREQSLDMVLAKADAKVSQDLASKGRFLLLAMFHMRRLRSWLGVRQKQMGRLRPWLGARRREIRQYFHRT